MDRPGTEPIPWSRRSTLAGLGAATLLPARLGAAAAVTLRTLLTTPLLAPFYRGHPGGRLDDDGTAGTNQLFWRPSAVEEQRQGAEWVIHGLAARRREWVEAGWRALDLGISWQQDDGGFGRRGYLHANALFLESLARALVVHRAAMTPARRIALARGCDWMLSPPALAQGVPINAPYTHRRYILAACFGEAGQVLGDRRLAAMGARWANEGLAMQRADGCNPELGDGDVNYQMAGILAAMRYYPTASPVMQGRLRRMVSRAIAWELPFIRADGKIDMATSTRAGHEKDSIGRTKQVHRPELVQAIGYADAIMPNPAWRRAARAVALDAQLPVGPA